jgi:hypothetical protein
MGCCSITLLGCYSFTLVAIVSHYQIPILAIPPMLLLLFFCIVSCCSYCITCVMVRYYPPLPSPCVGGVLLPTTTIPPMLLLMFCHIFSYCSSYVICGYGDILFPPVTYVGAKTPFQLKTKKNKCEFFSK